MKFDLQNIWQALFSNGFLLIILYLFRDAIGRFLSKGIESHFNAKIDAAKSEARKAEEVLRSELNARNAEISALRDNILHFSGERRATLAKRKIEAAERLWAHSQKLAQLTLSVEFMKLIKFDKAVKESNKPNVRMYFETLVRAANVDEILADLKANNLGTERLFLSSTAWAYFSVYQAIVFDAAMRLKFLELGVGNLDLIDKETLGPMIVKLIPSASKGIKEHGDIFAYYLLGQIQEELLSHLRKTVNGDGEEEFGIKQASEIIKLANQALKDRNLVSTTPPDIPEEIAKKKTPDIDSQS